MKAAFVLLTLFILAVPSVTAQSSNDVYFTADENGGTGTFLLSADGFGSGSDLQLAAETSYIWTTSTPLAASASLQNATFRFTIFFAESGSNVTISYGHWNATSGFVALDSASLRIMPEERTITNSLGIKSVISIGKLDNNLTGLNGILPFETYPAVQLTPDSAETMYTSESVLGATSASTATIPLPELSTIVLMGMGLATVGGVVYLRRRA